MKSEVKAIGNRLQITRFFKLNERWSLPTGRSPRNCSSGRGAKMQRK